MLAGHGRGLFQYFGYYLVPQRWWGVRAWHKLIAGLDPWIVEMLDAHRKVILQIEARMEQLEQNTANKPATLIEESAVRGIGELARAQMRAEVLDWHRFNNRNQVGSFIGCCPSEYSSGGSRRLGSIDRMGNKRLRCMLVEASGASPVESKLARISQVPSCSEDPESKPERLPERKPL